MGGCLGSRKPLPKEKLGIQTKKEENDHKFKVVILGDVAVGKTSILNVLKGNQKELT